MPNSYSLRVDSEAVPPTITLVDSAGIAITSGEITASATSADLLAWGTEAASQHEATIAQKAAEAAAAAATEAAATANAASLKSALEAETITI